MATGNTPAVHFSLFASNMEMAKHRILKNDKQHLMSIMQDLVFAKTYQEFEENEPLFLSDIFLFGQR